MFLDQQLHTERLERLFLHQNSASFEIVGIMKWHPWSWSISHNVYHLNLSFEFVCPEIRRRHFNLNVMLTKSKPMRKNLLKCIALNKVRMERRNLTISKHRNLIFGSSLILVSFIFIYLGDKPHKPRCCVTICSVKIETTEGQDFK